MGTESAGNNLQYFFQPCTPQKLKIDSKNDGLENVSPFIDVAISGI